MIILKISTSTEHRGFQLFPDYREKWLFSRSGLQTLAVSKNCLPNLSHSPLLIRVVLCTYRLQVDPLYSLILPLAPCMLSMLHFRTSLILPPIVNSLLATHLSAGQTIESLAPPLTIEINLPLWCGSVISYLSRVFLEQSFQRTRASCSNKNSRTSCRNVSILGLRVSA